MINLNLSELSLEDAMMKALGTATAIGSHPGELTAHEQIEIGHLYEQLMARIRQAQPVYE